MTERALSLSTDPFNWAPLVQFGAGLALFYGAVKFFENIEKGINDDAKVRIALWILSRDFRGRASLAAETFATLLDKVFGKRHLSLKCILRSIAASLIFLVSLTLFYVVAINHSTDPLVLLLSVIQVIILGLVFNVFPDYVSLVTTRYCLSGARRVKSGLSVFFLAMANVGLCALIYVVFMILTLEIFSSTSCNVLEPLPCRYFQWGGSKARVEITIDGSFRRYLSISPLSSLEQHTYSRDPKSYKFIDYPRIFFVATFFTTIWLWLYLVGSAAVRLAATFDFLRDWLDVENKPLYAIGLMVGCLLASIWWMGAAAMLFL